MQRPLPFDRGHHRGLPVQQPAGGEGHRKRDGGRQVGNERLVGCGDAGPGYPRRGEERAGERQAQHERRPRAAQRQTEPGVETGAQPAVLAERGVHQRPQRQRHGVEQRQHVEEPEMRERERQGRGRLRRVGGRPRQLAPHAPPHRRDDHRKEDDPADDERHHDPQAAVADERPHATALDEQAREETGDEEEQGHPEHVDDEEGDAERGARGAVEQRPDVKPGRYDIAAWRTTPARSANPRKASRA